MIVVKTELEVGVNFIYTTRQRINDVQDSALGLSTVLSESGIISFGRPNTIIPLGAKRALCSTSDRIRLV